MHRFAFIYFFYIDYENDYQYSSHKRVSTHTHKWDLRLVPSWRLVQHTTTFSIDWIVVCKCHCVYVVWSGYGIVRVYVTTCVLLGYYICNIYWFFIIKKRRRRSVYFWFQNSMMFHRSFASNCANKSRG